jgi:hypothetical protein
MGCFEPHVHECVGDRRTKRGTIVCLPKKPDPGGQEDYRPLTLLNADYKILTRIIASRLHPWMRELLQSGRQGNAIFEAVAAIRDIIAYTEAQCVRVPPDIRL